MRKVMRSPLTARLCLVSLAVLQIAMLMVAFEQPAHAYVDPGSSFVFLQVLGSMAAGVIFYLRHQIRNLFGFIHKTEEPTATAGETGAAENHL